MDSKGHFDRSGVTLPYTIGVQCLKALTPAEIIVVDRSAAALELTKSWGADQTVVADGTHVAKVKEMTNGHGVEAVIDFVGEQGAQQDAIHDLDSGKLRGRGILVPQA
ncbi:MAG: zinc-binding dehydrogenase [Chloroflexi bacterium]|nr:MAG: zinc-binding dehydrogenase [Chloroflexota bacterium]